VKPPDPFFCNCLPCRCEREARRNAALSRLLDDVRTLEARRSRPRLRRVYGRSEGWRRRGAWWMDEDTLMIVGEKR
jgi:hypothetical protein